jgi:ribosomal subunit interface protein
MEIKFFKQNLELAPQIEDYITRKLQKLSRFSDKIMQARVDLSRKLHHDWNKIFRVEVNLRLPKKIIRAVERSSDLQNAFDEVERKLKRQLDKYKGHSETKRKQTAKIIRARKTVGREE